MEESQGDDMAPKASSSGSRFKIAKVAFADDPQSEQADDYKSPDKNPGDENENSQKTDLKLDISKRHDSELSTNTPYSAGVDLTYTDTHNLKTFGHNTHEALPHDDHYRNLLSATHALRTRPTLEELHGTVNKVS